MNAGGVTRDLGIVWSRKVVYDAIFFWKDAEKDELEEC